MIRRLLAWMTRRPPPAPHPHPRPRPHPPDLTLVGTKDLYREIAARYDASALVLVRFGTPPADAGSSGVLEVDQVQFLCRGVENTPGFLASVSELITADAMRELTEDDL